ncbi:MAG: type II secretion system F family protein [Bacillota bacterium]|jgi:tight adherence protein C|nr:type II secretion system F family protein [Bacillota bacterium]
MDKTGLMMVVFAAGTLMAFLFFSGRPIPEISKRASEIRKQKTPEEVEAEELARPFSERVITPLIDSLSTVTQRMMPGTMMARLRTRLQEAGRPVSVERFLGLKMIAAAATLALFLSVLLPTQPAEKRPMSLLLGIVCALSAFNLPDFWLSRKGEHRKVAMRRYLAEVMDLLCVSVEAGLGFDGAVQKVAEKFREPVAGEFKSYLIEVRLGKSRSEALRNLAKRTGLPEMQTFVAAIVQADQLGVSIATVLRTQSDALRTKRRQQAEERAMKAPIKMLIPLVFFIFPTLFLVLLGPAAIHFMTTLKGTIP